MQSITGKVKGEGQRKGIPYHDDSNTAIFLNYQTHSAGCDAPRNSAAEQFFAFTAI